MIQSASHERAVTNATRHKTLHTPPPQPEPQNETTTRSITAGTQNPTWPQPQEGHPHHQKPGETVASSTPTIRFTRQTGTPLNIGDVVPGFGVVQAAFPGQRKNVLKCHQPL